MNSRGQIFNIDKKNTSNNPSLTTQTIAPFLVMDVLEKANILAPSGRDIIHL
jgi:hypothetical protein